MKARFLYNKSLHSSSTWQTTTEKEFKKAMKDKRAMCGRLIKLGGLYEPSYLIRGFEVEEDTKND